MRELPEPDIRPEEARDMGLEELPYFAAESVLAIQKQAYEDACLDFLERAVLVENPTVRLAMKAHANAMLTASQEKK